ncbi:MAG TPA: cation transporter [Vicinamibacteria bacterium]|nr:cation transporter [Vicinamibacteria bacterium]
MRPLALLTVAALLAAPSPARADRVQVFSIQGADCSQCADRIKKALKPLKGVKKTEFDVQKVELTVRLADEVTDEAVVAAIGTAGLKAVAGAGKGAYVPHEGYPAGADVELLSPDGRAVGSLERQRVAGKHTVFDVYADWCGPCRLVDARLRELVGQRSDIAVRRLNVVDFDSPLASELGPGFVALPYLIVFSPSGKRTDIEGADFARLDRALAKP